MEVLLRNVPRDLSEDGLVKELTPFLKALAIVEWACDKPWKKPQAWLLFLRENDGNRFLSRHQKVAGKTPARDAKNIKTEHVPALVQPRARDVARLHILKTAIFVEKSTRKIESNAIAHLKHQREERKHAPPRDPDAPALSCMLVHMACGKMVLTEPLDTLTFAEQCRYHGEGLASFGRRRLSIASYAMRLNIEYNTIKDLIAGQRDKALTLVLTEPPKFYTKGQAKDGKFERVTSCPMWPEQARYAAHCLVYQLSLWPDSYQNIVAGLKSQDVISVTTQDMPLTRTPEPYTHDYTTCISAFEGKVQALGRARIKLLPFPLLFQVQSLVWNNYLHPAGGRAMLEVMESVAQDAKSKSKPLPFTTDSMKQIFQAIPYPCPGFTPSDLDVRQLLQNVIKSENRLRQDDPTRTGVYGAMLPNHQTWVLKATVTPTRIMLNGPDAESKNRVLRKFPDRSDYFLRVTFCDEDGHDLSFNPRVVNDIIFERYRKILRDGIQIAGRRFSFLGFSHSSLRSHSTWFSAPFTDSKLEHQDYDTILRSLGDFSDIRVPAKCAARIGQAFSEIPYAVPIFERNVNIRYIEDVKSEDGSRVFSDGVGTLSTAAMKEVWQYLPMRSSAPTCFQIRLAGIKGMLALDTELTGKVICIRKESMMKFQSRDFAELGICDAAVKPLPLVLNRQMIKIMEDMGVKDEWFIQQQTKALRMLRGVTATAANTSTFLEYQVVGTSMGFPRFIRQLDKMGIDYRRDMFLRSVVEHVVLRELRLLKHKARIPISKGVTLFGVMDETGYLLEDEVYVTFDKPRDKTRSSIERPSSYGAALVTRSPALHPGDVQVVKMVTPPKGHPLCSLRNCIVFSQRGERDLPSQLSGGDLDGDLFSIIWDTGAYPALMYSAADYPRVVPEGLDRVVTRDDIGDFFINFMKTDVLGLIANRHQIMADIQEDGTADPVCIKLAEMHSTAVDYSETGFPVRVNEIPRASRTRPDFLSPAPPLKLYDVGQIDHIGDPEEPEEDYDGGMGRSRIKYHRSEKILGRLYRGIDEKKIWNHDIHREIDTKGPSVWGQLSREVSSRVEALNLDIDFTRQTESAWKIRDLYETAIIDNMWTFSDIPRDHISEVEVFCGSILNKTGSQTRRQRDASIKLKDEMERTMAWIVQLIRDRGAGAEADTASSVAGGVAIGGDDAENRAREDVIELCCACLEVSSVKVASPIKPESFRVVAACCLLRELDALARSLDADAAASAGGGYIGVSGRQRRSQKTTLVMR